MIRRTAHAACRRPRYDRTISMTFTRIRTKLGCGRSSIRIKSGHDRAADDAHLCADR